MRPQRPVLRVALLGVGAAVAAFAVIAAWLGWQAHAYRAARDRATAIADGLVVDDGIGDEGDIRVRWVDRAGREHVQRFGIYGTDRYARGRAFAVAYDPADPAPAGFPADPDETAAEDDLVAPIWIAGVVAGLLVLVWALRGLLYWRAANRPGHRMAALALLGEHADGRLVSLGNTTWIALADTGEPRVPMAWQRVMWHPVVDSVKGHVDVVVHGDPTARGRVTVELPDGTRLVPVGRLRHGPPKRSVLHERADVRAGLEDSFNLPAGTLPPSARPWWRRGVALALVGATLGAVMGFLVGGGVAAPALVVGVSAVLVNGWALTGAEP
jgi:hypothetical protein